MIMIIAATHRVYQTHWNTRIVYNRCKQLLIIQGTDEENYVDLHTPKFMCNSCNPV